jgi:hypothetical protein
VLCLGAWLGLESQADALKAGRPVVRIGVLAWNVHLNRMNPTYLHTYRILYQPSYNTHILAVVQALELSIARP